MTLYEAQQKVLNVARAEIGYKEGYNNYIKYAADSWDNQFYGWDLQHQPWCDVFVDYCFTHAFTMQQGAAMTYQTIGRGSALCKTSASFYRNNGAFYNYPEIGDQIFFYYDGDINHTGIVEQVQGSGLNWTKVITIEGNSNDQVQRCTYTRGNSAIAGFGRPKWSIVVNNINDSNPTQPISTTPSINTNLQFGMRGEEVKQLQENLKKLGYDLGRWNVDGVFGADTLNAVKKFQKDHQLEVDGVAGPLTQAAIQKVLNSNSTTTPITAPVNPSEKTYVVKRGDTLWGIAQTQLGSGIRYTEIKKLNNLTSNIIYTGQILKLP